MIVKIYTTPTCGICKMIKQKLIEKNISFETYNLEDYAEQLDIYSAPVLELEDGTLLTSPIKMNEWINNH